MTNRNHFIIQNDDIKPLMVNVEPECVFVAVLAGEEVSVSETFGANPLTLSLSKSESGEVVISVWPGDGEVRLEKEDIDVLDLAREQVGA